MRPGAPEQIGESEMETKPITPPITSCPLLSLEEAAAFLGGKEHGATANFLRGQIASGELRFVKVGNTFCVTVEALLKWIKTHETAQE
jgi:excisionase family DNA binding protein